MAALEDGRFRNDDLLRPDAALRAPALLAVAAEILIDRKELDAADAVLSVALGAFPDDVRLNQLMGLRWSRAGELERARAWLEPLYQKHRDDDETAGITAGVYKRLWLADRAARQWLARAHKAYLHGWDRSRQTNAYLGVNAAATALFQGRENVARELACEVRDLLIHRQEILAQGRPADGPLLGNWDQLSLAEALVVLRDFAAAHTAYQEALRNYPDQLGSIAVARMQLAHLLEALGVAARADAFLGGTPPASATP